MDASVLTLIIEKFSDILLKEVGLIAGAEDEIRSLRDELTLLTIFLKGINEGPELVQELVHQLHKVSYDAEDVVELYLLDAARHQRKKFVKKVFTGAGKLLRKRNLALQAKEIKEAIDLILRNKEKYGVRLDDDATTPGSGLQNGEGTSDPRRRRVNVEEENVVGLEQQSEEVIQMLIPEGGADNDELQVVSIIGMGGLGKSTLARKIFNSNQIKDGFGTRVWVVVSEHVEAKHVLKNILKCLDPSIKSDDDVNLRKELEEQLDGRRYLIVLDDLWTPELWEELRSYLPRDLKNGSRLLLTSRIQNVANASSIISTTYHLNPLGELDSWDLFCNKALKAKPCPPNLEDTGRGIVSKCKGLPLAIVVLGSLLKTAEETPSVRFWSRILNDRSWHPDEDNDCKKILSLSFRNLPLHLRPCFLYMGVFPEDFEISAKRLCLLWVAEGFVRPKGTRLEEDEAEQYLIDLVDRNLIMVWERRSDGGIKSCRVHDLLRDFCIKEAERCCLYKVSEGCSSGNVTQGTRRLTLHCSDLNTSFSPPIHKGLRSLLDFAGQKIHLKSVCHELTFMRVLHLGFGYYSFSSSEPIRIQNLILLRYLFLRGHQARRIPSLCKLLNLQVLDLQSGDIIQMPVGIWELKHLRHISAKPEVKIPQAPSSDSSMPYLQTLSRLLCENSTSELPTGGRFPNLRKLSILLRPDELWCQEILHSLHSLPHIVRFKINFRRYLTPDLDLSFVQYLTSYNFKPPHGLKVNLFPSTLTNIRFEFTALTLHQWKLLGQLQNLQVLKLRMTRSDDPDPLEYQFQNQPLLFQSEAFPQLIFLELKTCHRDLTLENGSLQSLQCLIIRNWEIFDSTFSALPAELWLSTTLRRVKLFDPIDDMKNYVRGLHVLNRAKVTVYDHYGHLARF